MCALLLRGLLLLRKQVFTDFKHHMFLLSLGSLVCVRCLDMAVPKQYYSHRLL
jgi:hypothetical protein